MIITEESYMVYTIYPEWVVQRSLTKVQAENLAKELNIFLLTMFNIKPERYFYKQYYKKEKII